MILQLLAGRLIAGAGIGVVSENDEARLAVGTDGSDYDQSLASHVGAGTRKTVGQERERVDAIEIVTAHRDRTIGMTGKRHWERRPGAGYLGAVLGERVVHVGADTVDVDVELERGRRRLSRTRWSWR